MTTHVRQFLCLKDNYGVLVHDSDTGATASIDAPDGEAIIAAAEAQGWRLTDALITHHHADHVQGLPALRARYPKLSVSAPAKEAARIGGVDRPLAEGDYARVGRLAAKVVETPGHTAGHIVYWFEEEEIAFVGDTLFALGCGRVFEAPPAVMWESLLKLASLPGSTQIYCGHEYTEANARFALTIEPDNAVLQGARRRSRDAARRRQADPADHHRRRACDQSVPARRRAGGAGGDRHGRRRPGGGLRRDPRAARIASEPNRLVWLPNR